MSILFNMELQPRHVELPTFEEIRAFIDSDSCSKENKKLRVIEERLVHKPFFEKSISYQIGNFKGDINLVVNDITLGQHNFLKESDIAYGKSVGGCRVVQELTQEETMSEAKNLARAMTRKEALVYFMGSLLDHEKKEITYDQLRSFLMGGCKTAIRVNDLEAYKKDKEFQHDLFIRFGLEVNSLSGLLTTGEDANTGPEQ